MATANDLDELLDEMADRRNREHAGAERDKRRAQARAAVECVFWLCAGLFCIGLGLHSTNAEFGKTFFYSGVIIGNGGIMFTLLAAYARGEARGDW